MASTDEVFRPAAYARFAGFNYLLIFVLAIFANFFVLSKLIVSGDPAATAANIAAQEDLFRIAIACFFVVLICDVFIAWALYLLLKKVDPHLSLLAALFRLTYTVAQIGVVLNLVSALRIADAAGSFGALAQEPWPYFFLAEHNAGFTLTLIFFGVHLALLGYLIVRSSFLPSLIGVLVMIAGAGYVIDGFSEILGFDYAGIPNAGLFIVILPALIGEGVLMLWLLIRGVDTQKWRAADA
ncbi:DUF4386 domain-containing protein [Hyphococcus luteus]|uniref:DUF4386 domain-containing protein n=1 Tax=Hyphococcus luteus TaxID=2058213 RepID=A0A2S7K936_9PROT|nr:DUF4386 domain-containing protein [Marinicaulis flavus]PQA89016.1 DUF4386 domain-containing protein [Marinicaulis flavus]